jgi:hypothetical protein
MRTTWTRSCVGGLHAGGPINRKSKIAYRKYTCRPHGGLLQFLRIGVGLKPAHKDICSIAEHKLCLRGRVSYKSGRIFLNNKQPSWFAVYTKPRQEHIALENLERQDFHCFLPMAINPYQRRSEKKLRIEPLFTTYLFLNVNPDHQILGPVR